jgi:hypothetical protein
VAEVETLEAASWYEDRQEGLGQDFLNAGVDALEAIEENPHQLPAWKPCERNETCVEYSYDDFHMLSFMKS